MTDLILSSNNDQVTMSSREIAELVNSRHVDVCRTIDRLIEKAAIGEYAPTAYTHHQNGQQYYEYKVGKRDSYVIVAQLSPEFTARLVDRWQELEAQKNALPDFSNPAIAARAWADEVESKQAAIAQLEQAQPAVAFANQVEASHGAISVSEAAKIIGAGQNRLFQFMRRHGWVTRRNQPYQRRIEAGHLDVKIQRYDHPDHGLKETVTTLVTGKGLRRLQQMWAEQQSMELH